MLIWDNVFKARLISNSHKAKPIQVLDDKKIPARFYNYLIGFHYHKTEHNRDHRLLMSSPLLNSFPFLL